MDEYLVPTQFGEDEFIEKKSRFIGRVWPVETEEEALAKIQEMKSSTMMPPITAGPILSVTVLCGFRMTENPVELPACPCCRFCSGRGCITSSVW